MGRQNAILIFSKSPHISRTDSSEPYASLPWGAIDTLFSAFLVDVLTHACDVQEADVLLYRNQAEPLDEFLTPLRERIVFGELADGKFSEQVHAAVDKTFGDGYKRVVAVLDNHPTISAKMFERMFAQLEYEDDCVVLGPTIEGKSFLIGVKANYGHLFDASTVDPLERQYVLLQRLCQLDAVLFLTEQRYLLDSGFSLARLREELALSPAAESAAARTYEVFKGFDKKYRMKYLPR